MLSRNNYNKEVYDHIGSLGTNQNEFEYESPESHKKSSGSYASLDDAFRETPMMMDLQRKFNDASIPDKNISNKNINNDYDLLTPQTEEKINNSVDRMMALGYNIHSQSVNTDHATPYIISKNKSSPNIVRSINSEHIMQSINSEHIMRPINSEHIMRPINSDVMRLTSPSQIQSPNSNYYIPLRSGHNQLSTGMKLFKFLLILILLLALIYGGYFLYKKYNKTTLDCPVITTNTNSPTDKFNPNKFSSDKFNSNKFNSNKFNFDDLSFNK